MLCFTTGKMADPCCRLSKVINFSTYKVVFVGGRCKVSKQKPNQIKKKQNKTTSQSSSSHPSLWVSKGIRNVYKTFHSFCLITWLGLVLKRPISPFTSLAQCIAISDKSLPTTKLLRQKVGSCYNSTIFWSCLTMFSQRLLLLQNTKQDTCDPYMQDSINPW